MIEIAWDNLALRSIFEIDETCFEEYGYQDGVKILRKFADLSAAESILDILAFCEFPSNEQEERYFNILVTHSIKVQVYINHKNLPRDNTCMLDYSRVYRLKIMKIISDGLDK